MDLKKTINRQQSLVIANNLKMHLLLEYSNYSFLTLVSSESSSVKSSLIFSIS